MVRIVEFWTLSTPLVVVYFSSSKYGTSYLTISFGLISGVHENPILFQLLVIFKNGFVVDGPGIAVYISVPPNSVS